MVMKTIIRRINAVTISNSDSSLASTTDASNNQVHHLDRRKADVGMWNDGNVCCLQFSGYLLMHDANSAAPVELTCLMGFGWLTESRPATAKALLGNEVLA